MERGGGQPQAGAGEGEGGQIGRKGNRGRRESAAGAKCTVCVPCRGGTDDRIIGEGEEGHWVTP